MLVYGPKPRATFKKATWQKGDLVSPLARQLINARFECRDERLTVSDRRNELQSRLAESCATEEQERSSQAHPCPCSHQPMRVPSPSRTTLEPETRLEDERFKRSYLTRLKLNDDEPNRHRHTLQRVQVQYCRFSTAGSVLQVQCSRFSTV
jgi:hypothetical protein